MFFLIGKRRHASMEPRSFERGKRRFVPSLVKLFYASMEPRSFERGKVDGVHEADLRDYASMEPRSFERGKVAGKMVDPVVRILQWSRVRLNAERRYRVHLFRSNCKPSMEPRSFERGKTMWPWLQADQ